MRTPQDLPRRIPRASRRTRVLLVVAVVVVIILIASLRGLANFWTDYLWFQSVHFTSVFKGVLLTKVVLSIVFIAIFFVLLIASLTVADRLAPLDVDQGSINDLVLRYRDFAFDRSLKIRLAVSAVFALLGGIGADRQWNSWDLFRYRQSFGIQDPQFHRDVGFYVFELPFIRWLVTWSFEAVVVVLILTTVFHYLNGGITPQSPTERVSAPVKAHLSVILGVLALIKAVSYHYDRLALVLSRSHTVDGATATSVHADSPAKFLLMIIAVVSAGLFLANIRQRGWILPAVGVVLWALVSVLVGAAYPALYQALRVNPSELTREAVYIQRNIDATQAAYNIGKNVKVSTNYKYSATVNPPEIQGSTQQAAVNQQTLSNVRLLDPAVNLLNTFNKLQNERGYYSFNDLDLDRYNYQVNGQSTETATVTSVRELNGNVPSGFVNQHLQYTHGYGAIQAPISESGVSSDGDPNFTLQDIPPTSTQPLVALSSNTNGTADTGSQVYYGEGPDTGGYVIAGSKTQEQDYENAQGAEVTNSYAGSGGVSAGSLIRRAAFALRFGDANFILSGQITPSSKVMYYRNILGEVQKAAPFLAFDADPYAVVLDNHIYWVADGYTTSNNYPYAQQANLDGLPAASGLNKNFNYVRNSVKVVVDAYTGQMTFFDMGTHDPILSAYEKAFPDLFKPVSQADSMFDGITAHWRYPQDYFQVQTNMYGRYHLSTASAFYSQAQAWAVSPDPGSGLLSTATPIGSTITGANGQTQTIVKRLAPQYIEAGSPDNSQAGVDFELITPFVPISATGSSQNLTAFITGSSDKGTYGQLTVYQLPPGVTVDGPGLISNAIHANPAISQELTLYNQQGSQAELGEVDVIPIDNTLLYIEPVYVESATNQIPILDDVVVVYDGVAYHSSNSGLDNALCQITNPDGTRPFSSYCNTIYANYSSHQPPTAIGGSSTSGSTTTTTTTTVPGAPNTVPSGSNLQSLLNAANQDAQNAQAALKAGNLAQYQADENAANAAVQQALALQNGSAKPGATTTTTKPATTPTTAHSP
ncbi:MAG TPA: UPF0182 family protein [Acidimicrobiales bacterium]|jgi:hypothetical protein|nr:UPF0182 family protein [Acidimicrobiales bacterium]